MGQVRSKVEGDFKDKISKIIDDVSECIKKKEEETIAEGKSEEKENIRKVALLQVVMAHIRSAQDRLKEY